LAAWPLITSAYQAACSLGFHTRQRGADAGAEFPNKSGMIFWIIFITEKVFSLRLGRPSTIATCDVTVPLPGGSHLAPESAMAYIRIMIRLALAQAKTYQDLYSAQALKLPDGARREIAAKLSREVLAIQEDCHKNYVRTEP
jgi:hypothetical protein